MTKHQRDEVQANRQTGSAGMNQPCSRRAVIKAGVKLAFTAPLLSTFFARDALAAGSVTSCYPDGQACGSNAACCSGNCDIGVTDQCIP